MLDNKVVYAASDLAAVLVSQGKTLAPKGGTILNRLSSTISGVGLGDITGLTTNTEEGNSKTFDQYFYAALVENSTNKLADGSDTEHTVLMNTLTDQLADSVSGTINFTRNVVNPLIKDISEKITAAMDDAGRGGYIVEVANGSRFLMTNGSLVVNISENGPDELFFDSVVESELNKKNRTAFKNIKSPNVFAPMPSDQILEVMRQSDNALVSDIVNVVTKMENGYDVLQTIFDSNFLATSNGIVRGSELNQYRNDLTLTPLITLAISIAFFDNMPASAIGVASAVNSRLAEWISQLKNMLSISLESYKNSLEKKEIVTHSYMNNFTLEITVNRESYQAYLNEGGSCEALIGACLTDKDYDYDNLLSNREKYEAVYESKCNEAANYASNNRLALFKNKLKELVYKAIFEPGEDSVRPVPESRARENLEKEMKLIFADALDNPFVTIRRVICRSIFDGTDAEHILVSIDKLMSDDDTLDAREASALVVLDYVTAYLVSQMEIKKA